MANRDILYEIERGAREIFEAILELILQFIKEMQKKNQSLEQQNLARILHTFYKEMEKNFSEQLRRQLSNQRISTIEWRDRSGNTMKLHLTDAQESGKEYSFQKLEGDKLLFQPVDKKGESIYLNINELDRVVPALEGRVHAMGTLSKLDEQQSVKSLTDAFQKAKQEGIPFSQAYSDQMGKKVKQGIHQTRLYDLQRAKTFNDYFQKRKDTIQFELNKIKIERMELTTNLEVGSISKEDFMERNRDLKNKEKKLTKKMDELKKGRNKLNSQLGKEIERHCPGLSTTNLSFEEKIALGENAFQYPEGLEKNQLRQSFEKDGNEKGLQLLDKAEGRAQEKGLEIGQETTSISLQSFSK